MIIMTWQDSCRLRLRATNISDGFGNETVLDYALRFRHGQLPQGDVLVEILLY